MLLNTGEKPVASQQQPADDHRLAARRQDDVLPGRARCSSPARWCNGCATGLGIDPHFGRRRAAGRTRCPTPAACISCRRSSAWAPVLGSVRPRRDRRPDARHDGGAHRPGGASSRWPIRRGTCSRRCRRTPACTLAQLKVDGGAAVNDADAVPGRSAGRAGPAAGRGRRRRRWARPTWPAWPSATGTGSTTCAATGRSTASSRRRWRREKSAIAAIEGGRRRLPGRRGGRAEED